MKSTKEINKRKSEIMDAIAKRGPLLLKDIYPHFDVSRQTVSSYLDDLVNAGCLRTIPVDEQMKQENDLSEGAGPFYAVDEDNLDDCTFLSDTEAQDIREDKNRVREYMFENGLVENPDTEKIKGFLEEFMPGGRFEDSDEIDIKGGEISSEGLSLREFQEFYELWFKVMASDPNWNVDVEMNISPQSSSGDRSDNRPDIILLERLEDFEKHFEQD